MQPPCRDAPPVSPRAVGERGIGGTGVSPVERSPTARG